MDGSNSRKSDAAATRKRRSSILKSQRAPRAPLSELEFHVATPQEQAKSRRVSFSRRTGVAEFEINEATTAWKNVYEEHNKSLETSVESGLKGGGGGGGGKRRVAHLGGRGAARHFEDEEADELELGAAPHELSAFTEHRTLQLFRLDAAPGAPEVTDLALDFSAVAPLADAEDDLDVLRRDLERVRRDDMSEISIDVDFNATHVSLKADVSGTDMSITDTVRSPRVAAAEERKSDDDWTTDKENIAVNPYVAPPAAEFDEGDDVLVFDGKKCKFQSKLDRSDDQLEAVKPLKHRGTINDEAAGDVSSPKRVGAAPPTDTLGECDISVTQAIPGTNINTEEFSHEHRTQFFDDMVDMTVTQSVPAQILQERERRRTIVYDGDDGHISMTEAVPAQLLSQKESERRKTIVYDGDDGHVSMTEAVPAQLLSQKESERRKTIVYDGDDGHISMTETVPAELLTLKESERRKTIVYDGDDGHLSMTEAVPAQLLSKKESERRKTIVYDDDDGHISMTEALPAQLLSQKELERRKTIVYDADDGHLSMTEALPAQLLSKKESERRKTIAYDDDDGHISMTEALPAQLLSQKESERRKTIVYDNDDGHISMTEAVPAQILPQKESERRKTIVYGNDEGNLSVTEVVPAQILPQKESERRKTTVYGDDDGHISVTGGVPAKILQQIESTRDKTIVYGKDEGNFSVTEAVPAQILQPKDHERRKTIVYGGVPAQILPQKEAGRRKTLINGNDDGHISMTEAVPAQILQQKESKRTRTIMYDADEGHVPVTEAAPAPIIQQSESERRKTIVYGADDGNLSVTQAVPVQILPDNEPERRKTIVYGNDDGHISVTEAVPAQILPQEQERRKTLVFGTDEGNVSVTETVPVQILQQKESERRKSTAYDSSHVSMTESLSTQFLPLKESTRRQTIVYGNNEGDVSTTEAVPPQILQQKESERRRTGGKVYGNEDGHVSMTEAVPAEIMPQKESDRRKTIMNDVDDGHVSMTEAVPAQILQKESERRTIVYNNENAEISLTKAVPVNIINDSKVQSKHDSVMRHAAPGQLVASEVSESVIERQQTVHFDNTMDMSVNRVVIREEVSPRVKPGHKNDGGHLSVSVGNSGLDKDGNNQPQHTPQRKTFGNNVSITEKANILASEEAELFKPTNERKTIVFEDNDRDVSTTGVVPTHDLVTEENEKAEATQLTDNRRTTVVEDSQEDISMTGDNDYQEEAIKQNDSRNTIVYDEYEGDVSMMGAIHNNILTPKINRQYDPSQIIVYEDEAIEVSRSVHQAPAIEPDEDVSLNSIVEEKISTTLNKSLVDKVLVYGASRALEQSLTLSPGASPGGSAPASPKISNKSSNSIYEDVKSPTATKHAGDPQRASLDALSLRSALESASMINALAQSPRRLSALPPGQTDRTSVLDVLLDMSSDDPLAKPSPPGSPQRTDSDATITNAPASKESIIMIQETNDPPALDGLGPLPLEYKKDKHGIVCKLQRRLSELKGIIHYKEKSPKKDARASSSAHDVERGNQTRPGAGSEWLNGSAATQAGGVDDTRAGGVDDTRAGGVDDTRAGGVDDTRAGGVDDTRAGGVDDTRAGGVDDTRAGGVDETRALLDALSELTDSRRSGDFTARGSRARRDASLAPEQKTIEARPNRKSIARSREDLLKDISMAQALMKAEIEQEESDSEPEREPVVRTLRFDDDEPSAVLRKPAGEPPGPRPGRAVIPAYLHDVSDHVKELVEDLMKPMAGAGAPVARSSGAQADLLPSSQLDLPSRPPLASCMARRLSPADPGRLSDDSSPRDSDTTLARERIITARTPTKSAPVPTADVIVFDHSNPLNNVLLPPVDAAAAHKYDPRRSSESLSPSLDCHGTQTEARGDVECGVALVAPRRDRSVAADDRPVDRAVDGRDAELRDTEVNTAIVMRANRDLLAGSSSLTLVDDALTRPAFDVAVDSRARSRSPVRVIFKLEEPYSSVKLDSELTSDADGSEAEAGKGQKRGRSPRRCTFAEDATPKPAIKVQKVSNSSRVVRRLRSLSPTRARARDDGSASASSRASTVTVQRLLSEFRLAPYARSRSPAGSCASSAEWRPELLHELSSKDLVSERDSAANVVAKIDVLPFMGTAECEWESRAADTWSFRLLRARLRLVVRLAHRSGNAARALVRADTPVRLVLVQHAPAAECSEPIASLCLCLAAAALQALARGVRRAGAVPALLRRAAAVARVARAWAAHMRRAHRRLAFSLSDAGLLSLKVANIPMRSVWEVTLRVELTEGAQAWPWPRACDVRVTRVVAAWAPDDDALRRLLAPVPGDWGHVPRVVWKIFKYLKNRRPEDDLLCV